MVLRLSFCAASLVCVLAGVPANADTSVRPEYAGAEAGLIGIECVPEGGTVGYRFRGVVIDTASAGNLHDVILTTGHGFPKDEALVTERCSIRGVNERRYPIRAIWRPNSRARGVIDDWAVVVTGRTLRERIWRQPVRAQHLAAGHQVAARQPPVRLPLRFLGAERSCTLRVPGADRVDLETGLFAHTCRSWSGHSGSPILIADDDGAFVMGIHVGRRWIPKVRQPFRIGRVIDTEIFDVIQHAVAWDERGSH